MNWFCFSFFAEEEISKLQNERDQKLQEVSTVNHNSQILVAYIEISFVFVWLS